MYKNVYLKKGKEESLKRFHPWVFSGAIHHTDDEIDEGETVRVVSLDGTFIAVGHWQIGSIAVRVLSFDDEEIDDEFWEKRLSSALEMRKSIVLGCIPTKFSLLPTRDNKKIPGRSQF